jgi:hypothetical protein
MPTPLELMNQYRNLSAGMHGHSIQGFSHGAAEATAADLPT